VSECVENSGGGGWENWGGGLYGGYMATVAACHICRDTISSDFFPALTSTHPYLFLFLCAWAE